MCLRTLAIISTLIVPVLLISVQDAQSEKKAAELVEDICRRMVSPVYKATVASWNFASNITDENQQANAKEQAGLASFLKQASEELSIYDYKTFENQTLKRLMKNLLIIGDAKLSEEDFRSIENSIENMKTRYAKIKIDGFKDNLKKFSLEPDITKVFSESRDPEELKYYWTNWYNAAGTPSKHDFFKYVELRNKAAKLNGFKDGSESWLDVYEDPTFEQQIENILEQMKPLYQQFHGYVRHRLAEFYGNETINVEKPIPMHLLGNIWAQQWPIEKLTLPFMDENLDVESEMVKKGYTPKKMFEDSEDFFTSIGLKPMPESFWINSIIEKPTDGREMICHASAWDFSIKNDVRVKQCTRITQESYTTVHHEMGHIEYYLYYDHLPIPFREGANPGFHEAIGDLIALSVTTPKHLHKKGLLKELNTDKKGVINQLFKMGLHKLPFLSFAYAIDKYRWEVFRGNVKKETANEYFWKLREKHGGITPPVKRNNDDFDLPAKYHGSADVEYLRYFVSFILQFQFHKAACIRANEYEPNNPNKILSSCDIYNSKEAGEQLKKMLALGASKPWHDALEVMTGQRTLDANALIEYFQPLHEWLLEENINLGVNIGW